MKYWRIIFLISLIGCRQSIHFPEGGYSYPKKVTDKDTGFLCYPLIDSLSTKDSFLVGVQGKFLLSSFNEPNLSLRPLGRIVFRMIYDSRYKVTIITLSENKIIVKQTIKGYPYPIGGDTSRLTSLEAFHYNLLQTNFPISEKRLKAKYRHYLDSLTTIYPQLLDPSYYEYLIVKSNIEDNKFKYSIKEIPIPSKTFVRLIDLFNSSGFWNFPHELKCENLPTDADGFLLEANTPSKYKIVSACPFDKFKFQQACAELVKEAGLENEFSFGYDDSIKSIDTLDIKEIDLDTVPIHH